MQTLHATKWLGEGANSAVLGVPERSSGSCGDDDHRPETPSYPLHSSICDISLKRCAGKKEFACGLILDGENPIVPGAPEKSCMINSELPPKCRTTAPGDAEEIGAE